MKLFTDYLKINKNILISILVIIIIFFITFTLYQVPIEPILTGFLCVLVVLIPGFIFGYNKYKRNVLLFDNLIKNKKYSIDTLPKANYLYEKKYKELINESLESNKQLTIESDKKYQDLNEYFTLWAHQIKTPISAMRLMLNETHSDIKEQLFKIDEYVNMSLQYLRMGSISNDLLLKEYDLDEIIKQALRKYSVLFIKKKLSLNYNETNLKVITDEKWLLFVLEQILSNALKYTNTGSVTIENKGYDLIIKDTGIGISKEDINRVGEKGYTGYNGRLDKKSTGLGLYLCFTILKKLGHKIKIDSNINEGTIVTINLERV